MFLLFNSCDRPEPVILPLRQTCVTFCIVCVEFFHLFRGLIGDWFCVSVAAPDTVLRSAATCWLLGSSPDSPEIGPAPRSSDDGICTYGESTPGPDYTVSKPPLSVAD